MKAPVLDQGFRGLVGLGFRDTMRLVCIYRVLVRILNPKPYIAKP